MGKFGATASSLPAKPPSTAFLPCARQEQHLLKGPVMPFANSKHNERTQSKVGSWGGSVLERCVRSSLDEVGLGCSAHGQPSCWERALQGRTAFPYAPTAYA